MAQTQRQPYQHLSYLVSTTRNDPGLLILSSRQLLKHVCRAINNKASHDKDRTHFIIVVIFPSGLYSQVIVTSFCTEKACSPQDMYMVVTDSIYLTTNRAGVKRLTSDMTKCKMCDNNSGEFLPWRVN